MNCFCLIEFGCLLEAVWAFDHQINHSGDLSGEGSALLFAELLFLYQSRFVLLSDSLHRF